MNDEFADLENELRGLEPRAPSRHLIEQIGARLDAAESSRCPVRWWQRLGFNHLSAAFGWAVVSPVLTAVIVTLVVTHLGGTPPSPAPPLLHPFTPAVSAASGFASTAAPQAAHATNVLYQTLDEGVVFDGGQEPVHRLRYRSADLVQWSNPHTGARWEVSYPREDVLLVPIQAE